MLSVFAQTTFVGPEVQWFALSPLIALVGGGLLLMVLAALLPKWPRGLYAGSTVAVAGTALVLSVFLWHDVHKHGPKSLVGGALGFDGFSVFITILISASVILSALLMDDYLRREGLDGIETYALLLMAASGGIVMASANDLVVLFIGLETLSIALYVLAGSHLRRIESQEAAVKYFVLGGFSSAFFLYGVALTYGATGTTNLAGILDYLSKTAIIENKLLLAGMALMLVGLAFKVAAVPFHVWTPDVYEGSPTPVAGFMASAAKAAAFAALLRVFVVTLTTYRVDWRPVVFALAALTLVVGSLLAIVQTNVKRMLAYSSISHAGFIMVGVQAATAKGTQSALAYLFAYAVLVIGTFGVIELVARTGDAATDLAGFRGLGRDRPGLALVLTVFLMAQAGVPLTSGFIAKFGVIVAAVDAKSYAIAIVAMLAAVVAAFLYLRIIVAMYMADPEKGDDTREKVRVPFAAGVALTLCVGVTLTIGIAPSLLVDVARDAIPTLVAPK